MTAMSEAHSNATLPTSTFHKHLHSQALAQHALASKAQPLYAQALSLPQHTTRVLICEM